MHEVNQLINWLILSGIETGRYVFLYCSASFLEGERVGIIPVDCEKKRVMIRLACMMRLFSAEDGLLLKSAFGSLPESVQHESISVFDLTTPDHSRTTPTYMPAVLINIVENKACGSHRATRLRCAVTLGIPMLLRALALSEKVQTGVPMNFHSLAGLMRASEVQDLVRLPLQVNATTGVVTLDK